MDEQDQSGLPPAAQDLLPAATDQLRALMEQHGVEAAQPSGPAIVGATAPARGAGLFVMLANPIVQMFVGWVANQLADRWLPQLRDAIGRMDRAEIERLMNEMFAYFGAAKPFSGT